MYKRYTKEFKNEIIQRFLKRETVISISYDTRNPRTTIYRWISDYKKENRFPKKFINNTIDELQNRIQKLETLLKIINEVGVSPQAPLKEKLNAMAPLYKKYKVYWLCEAMQVDRGTFYNHLFRGKHGDTFHAQQKKILKEAIQKIYDENRQIYGATKITAILKLQGYHTCENTVSMLMREMKIGSIRQQAKAIYEIDKRLELKNRLNQQFQVTGPNQVWVSDVTCFKVLNKTYFICAILDLYARKIIAYRVSSNNSTHLIKQTMQDAYEVRQPKGSLMFHSDRGSNYCSKAFSEYLDSLEIIERSFSRKGTPYDNAVIESFFSSLKREELYRMKYRSEKDFLSSLDDYIVAIVGVVKDMTLLSTAKSNYILQVVLIEVGIAIVSGILWVINMKRRIVTPIRQLNQASLNMVEHLEDGTSPEIIVKKDDEIKDLADCFTKMYQEIGEYISQLKTVTAEKERIGAELDVVAKIQTSMLPCIFPPFPNRKEFDIYATMDPAKEVGGDFYDFFMMDEDHLAFVVADVSGKGVPAALFMVIGKTLIKDHTGLHSDLGEVFTEVNNILCASNSEEMFITAFEGVLNLKTGGLRYVNAGHETPFICRKNGTYEPFKIKSGFVLAGMKGIHYKSGSVQLEPGDKIFEYSDGIPEATNANNEQYGMKRLANVLARESKKTPTELLPLIKHDLNDFVKDAEQFDDITMLCVQFNGTGKNAEISVKPDKDCIQTVSAFVEKTMDEWQIPMKTATKVQIAVDEIFSNIVNYSGANNAKLTVTNRDEKLLLTFEDDGIQYDPTTAKEPDITLSAEEREVGGLGIFMVKKMASDVSYEYRDGKNLLTVETVILD